MQTTTHGMRETDNRGVSPVIGVVLMIAVTVILTGVIATFVLSFGADAKAPPQATITLEEDGEDNTSLIITHRSGQVLDLDELYVRGDVAIDGALGGHGETLSGGQTINVSFDEPPAPGEIVTLVWDVGSDATILAQHRWVGDD